MTDEVAPPRDLRQRWADTQRLLADEVDCWVATAGPGGSPWMIPLSFLWHDGELVLATAGSSPTGRNWAAGAPVRIGLGQVRDVVLVEGTVRLVPASEVDAAVGDAFATKTGFDPRALRTPYVYAFVRPTTLQAWREENELADRDLVEDGAWIVSDGGR
jgi:nitroimidazol reductase NimA-like FMN-containing flavoprotein (pyridoxamine 5'-phosphate oxidase superfamily)